VHEGEAWRNHGTGSAFCKNVHRGEALKRISACAVVLLFAVAATAGADVLRLLDDPRDAAQARVDIIQQAHEEIEAVYFLARNDNITFTALALLREAHRRGVTTRLVVDAAFQHIPKPMLAYLGDEGVEIRVYHPLTLRHPSWIFRRMHEKFVVVDARRYIAGGRNLDGAYFGLARKNFRDRDVYVEGESAIDVEGHFETLWASEDVTTLHVRVSDKAKRRAAEQLDGVMAGLRRGGGFVSIDTGRNWSHGRVDVAGVDFLHDPVTGDEPRVGDRVGDLIGSATSSIVIESPYVVPTKSILQLLQKKCRDGIGIEIVTNSFRSTDGLLTYVAYLKYRRRLVRQGVDIREYKGPDTLHSKSIVIDGSTALVGSFNLDQRSQKLNAEVMCAVRDGAIAHEVLDSIARDARNASRVAVHLNRVQKWRIRFWRLLLPLIEPQL
jgi:putative cardiolipin synthase